MTRKFPKFSDLDHLVRVTASSPAESSFERTSNSPSLPAWVGAMQKSNTAWCLLHSGLLWVWPGQRFTSCVHCLARGAICFWSGSSKLRTRCCFCTWNNTHNTQVSQRRRKELCQWMRQRPGTMAVCKSAFCQLYYRCSTDGFETRFEKLQMPPRGVDPARSRLLQEAL